jgi:transposase InsO family protein
MFGEQGLLDQSSRPGRSPMATSDDIVDAILQLRKAEKWGATRIAEHLKSVGIPVSPATAHRILERHGLSRLRDIDPPTGELLRGVVQRYEHERCGDMVHVDIKKVGQIPKGGGWAIHGKDSEQGRASKRKGKGTGRIGYTYVHSAIDDYSRLGYSEPLDDEKGPTAAAWWDRACGFFAEYGIVVIERCLTDNGSCYRSRVWAGALAATQTRHKRTRPYTPRTNGKVERYNGTLIAEWARKRPYDSEADRRAALVDFLNYYNNERPHSAIGYVPPAMRTPKAGFVMAPDQTERHTLEVTQDQLDIFRDLYPDL